MKLLLAAKASGHAKYGAILWPIVIGLGWVINRIYYLLTDILPFPEKGSVAAAIAILTILIYLALYPLTYKQQKFSILSRKMQPEIKKIQEKYKGKTDSSSMAAMQEETTAIYDKYGISPTGSCIQLIIQMPILFALYRVFYNITDFIKASESAYGLFNLNISETPWNYMKDNFPDHLGIVIVALLFPVASYASQVLNMKTAQANTTDPNDPNARQMRIMNLMMPFMSFVFAFTVPVGLTWYWIVGALVRTAQQLFLNKKFKEIDLDDIIEANKEKAAKKAEKRGIRRAQIYNAANMRTKSVSSNEKKGPDAKQILKRDQDLAKADEERKKARKGSMAYKINLINDYNNRNSKGSKK